MRNRRNEYLHGSLAKDQKNGSWLPKVAWEAVTVNIHCLVSYVWSMKHVVCNESGKTSVSEQ